MPHAAAPHAPQRPQPPVSSASLIVQPVGAPAVADLAVYLYYDVLDELFYHARFRQEPAATLLLGSYGAREDGSSFIEIRGFMEAMYLGSPRDWFVTLQHRYAQLAEHLQATRPSTAILGGSYALPGHGAQLSAEVAQIQLTFFTLPHQVLLAVDAASGELALYRRGASGALERLGFYIVARPEELDQLRAAAPGLAAAQAAEPARAAAEPAPSSPAPSWPPRSPERPAPAPARTSQSAPALQSAPPRPVEPQPKPLEAAPSPLAAPQAAATASTKPDPWFSTLGLNVQAEVDAAVEAARQKQEKQAKAAKKGEGDSFVSTLNDIMDSTSRRAVRQSSPRISAADQLASLLPPAPVPRQEPPGQLFAWPGEEIAETPPGELLAELFPKPAPAPAPLPELPLEPLPEPELIPEPLVADAPEEPIWEYATSFGSGRHRAVDRAPSEEAATLVGPAPAPPPRPTPPRNPRPLILDDTPREPPEDIGLHQVTAPQRSGDLGDRQRLRQLLDVVRDALTEKHAEQSSGTRWPAVSPKIEEALHESLDESAGWEEVDLNRLPTGPPPSGAELRQRLQKIRDSGRHYALSRSGTIKKIDKTDPG